MGGGCWMGVKLLPPPLLFCWFDKRKSRSWGKEAWPMLALGMDDWICMRFGDSRMSRLETRAVRSVDWRSVRAVEVVRVLRALRGVSMRNGKSVFVGGGVASSQLSSLSIMFYKPRPKLKSQTKPREFWWYQFERQATPICDKNRRSVVRTMDDCFFTLLNWQNDLLLLEYLMKSGKILEIQFKNKHLNYNNERFKNNQEPPKRRRWRWRIVPKLKNSNQIVFLFSSSADIHFESFSSLLTERKSKSQTLLPDFNKKQQLKNRKQLSACTCICLRATAATNALFHPSKSVEQIDEACYTWKSQAKSSGGRADGPGAGSCHWHDKAV